MSPAEVPPSIQMIALGVIILAAHVGGRICDRLRLSEVTGQMIGGALAGSYALHALHILPDSFRLYDNALSGFHFFVFMFLSIVAFGIGEELHISRLKNVGRIALVVALAQGIFSWIFVFGAFLLVTRLNISYLSPMPVKMAMLIASIGIASAPAVTFVLMNQLRVEGRLRHLLGSVVVLADLFEVILFSVLVQVLLREQAGSGSGGGSIFLPVLRDIGLAALIAGILYVAFLILVRKDHSALQDKHHYENTAETDFLHRVLAAHPSPSAEILLVVIALVSIGTGVAYFEHLPFLITAILAGFLVANFHSHAIFNSLKIDNIAPVFNLTFFALIGANISFANIGLDAAILAGVYVLSRFSGKMVGTWIGCKIVGEDRKITACLPMLLLPQAGVAAVETVFASTVLGLPEIAAIIIPAIAFFQIAGVYLVDKTLRKWRSWVADEEAALRLQRAQSGQAEAAMRLLDYLTPEYVLLDTATPSKNTTIELMVDHARLNGEQHIDRSQALQVLGEREQLAPTGFGNGIAIPHCRLIDLDRPVLVFTRHKNGVIFGGVDNEPCKLILMILSPARDPGVHLRLLAAAAHVFGDEQMRSQLLNAATPDELLHSIAEMGQGAN